MESTFTQTHVLYVYETNRPVGFLVEYILSLMRTQATGIQVKKLLYSLLMVTNSRVTCTVRKY